CEGTNILISNGIEAGQEVPHVSLHIIARKTGDGLSFDWTPKPLTDQETAAVEIQLKQELEKVDEEGENAEERPDERRPDEQKPDEPGKTEKKPDEQDTGKDEGDAPEKVPAGEDNEENYLIKQLKRLP
ncbi:HIT domain-containing protein, partial [Nanoarchaeota archaeon]